MRLGEASIGCEAKPKRTMTYETSSVHDKQLSHDLSPFHIQLLAGNSDCHMVTVADLGGVRGVQMHPPLAASNVFCVHNCTSPSNDYAAVACSNNNQAQLHTHVSVPY